MERLIPNHGHSRSYKYPTRRTNYSGKLNSFEGLSAGCCFTVNGCPGTSCKGWSGLSPPGVHYIGKEKTLCD